MVRILGELAAIKFSKKYADSRNPLARFLQLAKTAEWKNFVEVKATFPAADYIPGSGTIVFDIGGNKYRLIARVDFEEQLLSIESILTHEQYNSENL